MLSHKVNLVESYTLSLSSWEPFLVTYHQYSPSTHTDGSNNIKKGLSSNYWGQMYKFPMIDSVLWISEVHFQTLFLFYFNFVLFLLFSIFKDRFILTKNMFHFIRRYPNNLREKFPGYKIVRIFIYLFCFIFVCKSKGLTFWIL